MAEDSFEPPPFSDLSDLLEFQVRDVRRRPITTASEAKVYAEEVTTHIYGPEEARAQLPYHAYANDGGWRVKGSKPWNIAGKEGMEGPITLIFGWGGEVRNMYMTSDMIAPPYPQPEH